MTRENCFITPFGKLILERYPLEKHNPLRAWNAADELLLEQINTEQLLQQPTSKILIINDASGALTLPLLHTRDNLEITCWSDSYLCQRGIEENLSRNGLSPDSLHFLPSTSPPAKTYNMVLMQVPKTRSLLEYQLHQLKSRLCPGTPIIAGAMVKHLQGSFIECFEKVIGPTHTSLAKKKARLIFSTLDTTLAPNSLADNTSYPLERWPLTLVNLCNVFSRQKLDIGTRFFLPHLDSNHEKVKTIFDLGCGNGALGIAAGHLNPTASIHFFDESYLAVKSAQLSFEANKLENPARYKTTDCLDGVQQKADLILCNPPFHQSNTIHIGIALRMFKQARRHLNPGGQLRIVGNRHLNYHIHLKKTFPKVRQLDANKKFVILQASI